MTQEHPHIVFAEPFDEAVVERARAVGRVTLLDHCDEASLCNQVSDCDALLVRTRSQVTRRVIESGECLRVVGRGGSGVDNIDLEAAGEHRVVVVHTPDASTDAVADLTVGMMIALLRSLVSGHEAVLAGKFAEARRESIGLEMGELTLGIIGMGRIGQAVARRCRAAFGTRVIYHDVVHIGYLDFVATPVDREVLLREADIVSLHVPLSVTTRGMIDGRALALMNPGAFLINTARGAVVDHDALADALATGRLAGAALDVVDPEPLPLDHALCGASNVILSPHVGGRTHASLARMNEVVDDVLGVLAGKKPCHPVELSSPSAEGLPHVE